jgi:truncated hemoglobin YjbI
MMLTATDVALVRASFAKVLPIKDTAADLFYDRLFEIAPQLRPMFPKNLKEQKAKLMAMIAAAAAGCTIWRGSFPRSRRSVHVTPIMASRLRTTALSARL